MEREDLIRKLETLKPPEFEPPVYKQALKRALLNSRHFERRTIVDWAKVLAPVMAAVVLVAIVGFPGLIQARQWSQAEEIIRNCSQIQEFAQSGGLKITDIQEVKLQDGEASVLVRCEPTCWVNSSPPCNMPASGYKLTVDLEERKVSDPVRVY